MTRRVESIVSVCLFVRASDSLSNNWNILMKLGTLVPWYLRRDGFANGHNWTNASPITKPQIKASVGWTFLKIGPGSFYVKCIHLPNHSSYITKDCTYKFFRHLLWQSDGNPAHPHIKLCANSVFNIIYAISSLYIVKIRKHVVFLKLIIII